MKRQFEREISDLLSCQITDVDENYDRILRHFQRRANVGLMTFFRCVEIDGSPHYDRMRCSGEPEADEVAEQLEGNPVLQGPTLDFCMPGTDEVNSFVHHDADSPIFDGSQVARKFLKPLEIHSAARIMVYRGDEFIGWLGCFRRGDQPRSDAALRRQLAPMAGPVCAAISNIDQLHCQQLSDIEGAAVLTPKGRLDFASPVIQEFLDDAKRTRLADIVKDLDAGDISQCIQLVGGVEVRITRLEGKGMFRYLAQFIPPKTPDLNPLSQLTAAQREVAEYAVAGATNKEIAEATDRSPATVKVHMRNIYDRLGIGSRVELVQRLG